MSTFNSDSHALNTGLGSDYTAYLQEIAARKQTAEKPKVDIAMIHANFDKNWTSKNIFAGMTPPNWSPN